MGTRADFYVAREDGLEWVGSIAWDGYPEGIDADVLTATSADAFGLALETFFADRDDVTLPVQGWPWPWSNSNTTDHAYVLIEGEGVLFTTFGKHPSWADRFNEDGSPQAARATVAFPDLSASANVAAGARSGTIMVHAA